MSLAPYDAYRLPRASNIRHTRHIRLHDLRAAYVADRYMPCTLELLASRLRKYVIRMRCP